MAILANVFTKELTIKLATTDLNNVTKDYPLPGFSNKVLVVNPSLNNNGYMNLCTTKTSWKLLSSEFDTGLIELHSDKLFYVKVEKDESTSLVIQTKSFSYNNPDIPIRVSVANGTFDYEPLTNTFTTNETSVDIRVYFIGISYTDAC